MVGENRNKKVGRLYSQVAEKLAYVITSGEYKVGDRLAAERDLAVQFGVSRPTIREAIIALELEGMVEVRIGSGVYVHSLSLTSEPTTEQSKYNVSPFELIEARCILESEIAALAAKHITEDQLQEMETLLIDMENENRRNIEGEYADRQFHRIIAEATGNNAMIAVFEHLWDFKYKSPICLHMLERVRSKGIKPRIDEHRTIFDALRKHDSEAARISVNSHLTRVLNSILDATEVEEIEKTHAKIEAKRERYSAAKNV